jgi:hypothetical protein
MVDHNHVAFRGKWNSCSTTFPTPPPLLLPEWSLGGLCHSPRPAPNTVLRVQQFKKDIGKHIKLAQQVSSLSQPPTICVNPNHIIWENQHRRRYLPHRNKQNRPITGFMTARYEPESSTMDYSSSSEKDNSSYSGSSPQYPNDQI